MEFKSYIKNNKCFTSISVIFLIWFVFLIILSFMGERRVIFYDALGQIDVSSEFVSKLPFLRYLLEPFMAIALILEYEFTWLILFFVLYPILRVFYLYLKKNRWSSSEKYRLITYILVDIISFSFKVLILAVLIIGMYIVIGYTIYGYFFIGRYFMVPVQIGVHIAMILIFIKIVYILVKLFHPKLKLNLSRKFSNKKTKRSSKVHLIKRETILYIGIGVLLIGTNIVLISTPFPPHKIQPIVPLEDDEFLFDFHVHTIMSDGWLTVEERINWYLQQGISGAAFSDHDNIRGAKMAQKYVEEHNLVFTVLMAEEWTNNAPNPEIHMNYFSIAEEIVPLQSYSPTSPKAMNASELIKYIKEKGGYITVNHYNYDPNPNGGFGLPYSLEQLRDWGVDGFEIVNGGSFSGKYEKIREYCIANDIICIGGSDIHTNEDINTFIKLKLADPTNLTITNIFETLKNNTHEVIAVNLNPKKVDFPSDINDFGFYVLEDFINYSLNIDVYQALSWIIWSGLVYLIFCLSYIKTKKVELGLMRRKIL